MRKKVFFIVLFLTITTSLVTGTYAIYTKSIAFNGTLTKVTETPAPPPSDDEDIVIDPSKTEGKPNVSKDENGDVTIQNRGDYLQLMNLPGNDYKVEADISNFKALNAFGIYVDGYYDVTTDRIYADVIQFVSGHLEMKRKSFRRYYDTGGNLITAEDQEDTYSLIANSEDISSIISGTPETIHITTIIQTKTNSKGELVKVPEVYINDTLVPNQTYPEREILHTGNKAYCGYRSWWGGKPNVAFQNLKVSSLSTTDFEEPDVIIPETGGGSDNSNITTDDSTGSVTITNVGDYVFAVDGITEDSYVVSAYIKVDIGGNGSLQEHLKGFGLYIDGSYASNGAVNADCLYFTNSGGTDQLNLTSYAMTPLTSNGKQVFEKVSFQDDAKVTTQGETELQYDDGIRGFYLIAAIKGDSLTGKKQVRVFIADQFMNKMKEVSQYYDTPWTGLPPIRTLYKKSDRIYVGYHSNNYDGRSIIYKDIKVSNGLDSIPSEFLHKYGW